MLVRDVMATEIEFAQPEDSIQEVARLLGDLGADAILVGSADAPRGILTGRDILLRVVSEGRDVTATPAADAMSSMLFSCRPDDSLQQALAIMAEHQVGQLPVLDDTGRVAGMVALGDLQPDAGAVAQPPT